jgi:peptide/nickel transport system substrate-binding protein
MITMAKERLFIGLIIIFVLFLVFNHKYKTRDSEKTTTSVKSAAIAAARGPASDSIIMHKVNSSQALPELLAGNIDYSLTPLLPEDAEKLRGNSDYVLYYATPQVNGLVFNPAPASDGSLNPFAIREVRFAMQFLVDRQRVVDEAYKGFALPIYLNINSEHPTYAIVKDDVDSYGFKYDWEKAFSIIDNALVSAGAKKDEGVWAYNGNPIKLKFYTNAGYPELAKMADIVSSELREAGFDVETVYVKRTDKNPVYESDPALLEWNVATTAWIYYSASRYESVSLPSLDKRDGWWSYENNETKKLEDRLNSGNYSSQKEWEDLVSEYAKLSLNDSQGMWIANSQTIFAARKEVRGLINDTYIGLRSYGNARDAYIPGKNTLSIGEDYVYESDQSWNPIVVNDISYMDILNTMHDPAVWSDVKTLVIGPYRWGYDIETLGPSGKMDVPQDAFLWDNETDRWVQAGNGVSATTKVTYDLSRYLGTKWHDGITISWADVLYFTASLWDASLDESKHDLFPDFWREDVKALKGLRIIDGNRIEVYSDKWSFDEGELLRYSRFFQRSAPWELYAAMDKAVYGEKAYVYSVDYRPVNATTQPLNLVNETHAQAILGILDKIAYSEVKSQVTAGGKTYATEKDLSDRRNALHMWYAEHGHLIVSDGPYYLEKYNFSDDSIELNAFRDPAYPFIKDKPAG